MAAVLMFSYMNRHFAKPQLLALLGAFCFLLASPPLTFATEQEQVAQKAQKQKVAFLNVEFQNDNEGLEPTSNAELRRLKALEQQFKMMLTRSGKYTFVALSKEQTSEIEGGQMLGECGGCEVAMGKKVGADLVAWIRVQKISNLILNMNVFMADVQINKMAFVHSVDIRGNTDKSWSKSLSYLVRNYLLNEQKS